MKEIYVDLWTMLKQESIGKKGKDIFDLLIRRTNEYKKVNKENTFESSMFKEEEINESGDQAVGMQSITEEKHELELEHGTPLIELFQNLTSYKDEYTNNEIQTSIKQLFPQITQKQFSSFSRELLQ